MKFGVVAAIVAVVAQQLGSPAPFADATGAAAASAASAQTQVKSKIGAVSTGNRDSRERLAAAPVDAGVGDENDDDDEAPAKTPDLITKDGRLQDRALRSVLAQRVREAKTEHKAMKAFMKNFARNFKLSVLEDSQGDMPEDERLAAIRALQRGGEPKSSLTGEEESALIAKRRPKKHHQVRMLNALPSGSAREDGEPVMLADRSEASGRRRLEEDGTKPSTRGLTKHWKRSSAISSCALSWAPLMVAAGALLAVGV